MFSISFIFFRMSMSSYVKWYFPTMELCIASPLWAPWFIVAVFSDMSWVLWLSVPWDASWPLEDAIDRGENDSAIIRAVAVMSMLFFMVFSFF
ncbi:hypothetical protein MTBBW1_300111 [Desulfamplus magnetovallimortis]|uniref:Uncharacterized protein n=1 Tax=Desulfamplus magnetovallimortis TaxID=1246637 RepID=A0A1W1HFX7_9BACT|nr:hypothetical protein MTBBW1_300111 [Desulfamplus magnetovallimortis]